MDEPSGLGPSASISVTTKVTMGGASLTVPTASEEEDYPPGLEEACRSCSLAFLGDMLATRGHD